jgi:Ca2+-binding RTX toxin-like protein
MSNGDDTVTTAGTGHLGQAVYVRGGTGDDTLDLTMANDEVTYVYGEEGDDTFDRSGGWGVGHTSGGPGADAICGNNTHVSYSTSTQGVRASIGGAPGDDGMPGEGDTICAAVVSLTGSDFADTLLAGQQAATLHGRLGNDALFGGPGNDTLFGEHGDDAILGGGGDDTISGLQDVDAVNGGSGTDTCYPDPLDALASCEAYLPLWL